MQKYLNISHGTRYARLKIFAYYVQRIITSRTVRRIAMRATAIHLRLLYGKDKYSERKSASTDALREKGYLLFDKLLSSSQCKEILAYLRDKPVFASRESGQHFVKDNPPENIAIGDYELECVVNCPHVMEIANHPAMLTLAANYLGYTPTITTMGIRWSFPTKNNDADVQAFHRDSEMGSIKLMVYLTDVDADSGPHVYVEGTHLDRMPVRLHRHSDLEVTREHGGGVSITGPAGTAFAIDTKGIHKGTPPISRARLLLGIQYSLLPCLIYDYEPVAYRGEVLYDHYINRLMVNNERIQPVVQEMRPEKIPVLRR